jgi:murein DD-endopeptidase
MMRRLAIAELLASALCLWAAWYHTPAGALLRSVGARIFSVRTSAQPLLAYYSAGVYGGRITAAPALAGPVPPAQALGYGVWAALADLDAGERAQLGLSSSAQPPQIAAQLHALAARLGSEEAAVLALFCGEEPARYALDRAGSDSLEDLARQLPPRYADRIALASQALMLGGAYALAWPLPESVHITSPFGVRDHPVLGGRKLHAGVDLGVPTGTLVRASGEGIVRRSSSDSQNGRTIMLDHGRGVVTVYCHNDELLVRVGQRVDKGQPITRSGNTGRSTGPHLHYQLDLAGQPVDPLRYRATKPKVARGAED